jgi:hypothetical protein
LSKAKKTKIILIGIFGAALLFIIYQYLSYMSLQTYEWDDNLITKDGIMYQDNPDLTYKYLNGEIKAAETIGRFKEDDFLGFKTWVIRLEGFDKKDAFLVRGLMYEGIYTKSISNES